MRSKLETLQSLDLCFTIFEKLDIWRNKTLTKEFRELVESCGSTIQKQIGLLTKDLK